MEWRYLSAHSHISSFEEHSYSRVQCEHVFCVVEYFLSQSDNQTTHPELEGGIERRTFVERTSDNRIRGLDPDVHCSEHSE